MKTKKYLLMLPVDLWERLKKVAKEELMSVADIIRMAIKNFLDRREK